jgi:hypothetical protein
MSIGVTTGCGVGNDKSISSMVFDADVAELSFTYVTTASSRYLFEALLDGVVVSSQAVNYNGAGQTKLLFKGSNFDTVRFTEDVSSGNSNWFWADNLSWRSATTSTVPEPASLALLGLGLAGMAATRRKRKQA